MRVTLQLSELPGSYAICRLGASDPIPSWTRKSRFLNVVRTAEELSVVCEQDWVPRKIKANRGWKCFRVQGSMDLSLIGVMASLAVPLAKSKISVFTVATYDTDYFLVKGKEAPRAKRVLREAGHYFG